MTRTGIKAAIKDLDELGSMCDSECWGRCRRCPDDVRRDTIAILQEVMATLPEEPKAKRAARRGRAGGEGA